MGAEEPFQVDRGEPLGLWWRWLPAAETPGELRALSFEYTSRGDRVPGRLLLPPQADGPFPLVLLQHGLRGSKQAPYLIQLAAPWVRSGVAVASIDFPLHGERGSEKLGELLRGALEVEGEAMPSGRSLLGEFMRQAVIDLRRALDAAEQLPMVNARRVAYVGLDLGSIVGAGFCGVDPRPCAAALVLGGGDCGSPPLEPTQHLARFAPRPLLLVNASRDPSAAPAPAEALYAAAGEPKEILCCDAACTELPGRVLEAMGLFLRRHLEVEEGG